MNVTIITGGSRGIGASTAIECGQRGFGVIVTYKNEAAKAEEVVRQITASGGKAAALHLNLDDPASFNDFRSAVSITLARNWGTNELSGLVNNAGYGQFNPIESVTEDEFDGLMNVHLKGPFFLTKTLLPLMKPGASIINLTSATTRVATVGVAPYASLKGGLEVLTRYMAKEFAERRIRVNSVSPGPIRTDLAGGLSAEFEARLALQTALGRIGEPSDVARVIAMLLTADGDWINAQNIEVAGGYLI